MQNLNQKSNRGDSTAVESDLQLNIYSDSGDNEDTAVGPLCGLVHPDTSGFLIGCDACDAWFDLKCTNIRNAIFIHNRTFKIKPCITGVTPNQKSTRVRMHQATQGAQSSIFIVNTFCSIFIVKRISLSQTTVLIVLLL